MSMDILQYDEFVHFKKSLSIFEDLYKILLTYEFLFRPFGLWFTLLAPKNFSMFTNLDILRYIFHYYHLFDNAAGGLLISPQEYHPSSSGCLSTDMAY